MLDIHSIMRGLAEKRPIFHSEADFQFALAWHIKETLLDCEVRLEWNPFPDENLRLDMWLPTYSTAIELKYPVAEPLNICHDGERFIPRKRRTPHSRYGFVKDIGRIERMIANNKVERGFAVLLTNHPGFWKRPTSRWQDTDSAAFRLHEDMKLQGTLRWKPGSSHLKTKTRRDPICLRRTYSVRWDDYWDFECGGKSLLRYLAVEVGN